VTPEEKAELIKFIRDLGDTAPPPSAEMMSEIRRLLPPVTEVPASRSDKAA
jgi:hypothetical protein